MDANLDPKARAEELFLRYIAERDLTSSDEFDAFTHEHPDVQEELRRLGADFMVMEERLEVAYPSLPPTGEGVRVAVNYRVVAGVVLLAVVAGVVASLWFHTTLGLAVLAGATVLAVGLVASLAFERIIAVHGE